MKDWVLLIADHPIACFFLAVVLGAGMEGVSDWIRAWRFPPEKDEKQPKGE